MKPVPVRRRVLHEQRVGVHQRLEVLVTDDGLCRVHLSLGPVSTSDRGLVRAMWQALKNAEQAMERSAVVDVLTAELVGQASIFDTTEGQ